MTDRRPVVRRLVTVAAAAFLAVTIVHSTAVRAEDDFDPATGYRIARYRAPVPDEAPGARRVDLDAVEALVADPGTVLLDVMAAEGAGPDPATGEWRLSKPRQHIPGSVWLPEVGRGVLDPGIEHYFKSHLDRLTGGDKSRRILIYCLADCWMGWNAAKRAASYGYTAVHWYPEGTDGWRDWDGPLAPAMPVAMTPADAALHVEARSRAAR
ncbi:MAG: rhodanese-like domain-containing protein [Hyphomicrobium sp.]